MQAAAGWGGKAHAQRHTAVLRQFSHLANGHVVRQAGAPLAGVGGQAPQRGKAWKAQKQRQHDGGAQQHQQARNAQQLAQAGVACRHVGVDQCGQQPPDGQQHGGGHGEGLRLQKQREQGEKAQEKNHHGITPRAHFQGFQHQQQHDQYHPGIRPDDGAKLQHRGPYGQYQQRSQQPGARQALPGARHPQAPCQQAHSQRTGPHRQISDVRQQHQCHYPQHQQGVACLAGQRGGRAAIHI